MKETTHGNHTSTFRLLSKKEKFYKAFFVEQCILFQSKQGLAVAL